ncbi:hypothetical protein QWY97_17795 [Vibrio cortegadensis]|uniref:hypothetical protein n=1 Tax=Vibrio cortegadensis TaxID=1328770 RepID=UPI0021C3EBCC|nr:hypothetical protein [Vibrio cortegadensis]MDN3699180.1 hypothetical protein [Vibrio cortegadensis]
MEKETIENAIRGCDYELLLDWVQSVYNETLSLDDTDRLGALGVNVYLKNLHQNEEQRAEKRTVRDKFKKYKILKNKALGVFEDIKLLSDNYKAIIKSNIHKSLINDDETHLCHSIDDVHVLLSNIINNKNDISVSDIQLLIDKTKQVVGDYDQITEVLTVNEGKRELDSLQKMLQDISGTRPHIYPGEGYALFLIIKSFDEWNQHLNKLNTLAGEFSALGKFKVDKRLSRCFDSSIESEVLYFFSKVEVVNSNP